MRNSTIEMSLLDPEERKMVEFIWKFIPAIDREGMSEDDVLFVLDQMDDYLLSIGLATEDRENGEITYLDGEVDETEQLNFVLNAAKEQQRSLTSSQIQLIQDAELQYGIEQGWYEE